ncbi:MAG: hypothetical protein R2855_03185 [Thermomicrobiales bacterium]
MMVRLGALVIVVLVLLVGLAGGYLAGMQSSDDTGPRWEAQQRTAERFYEALDALGQDPSDDRLGTLLAPEFTDQRLDIERTLTRADFMRAAVEEARTFPHRQFTPIRMTSDRGWVLAVVQVVDAEPGEFGAIPLPPVERLQRELLYLRDEWIVGRIVLEDAGTTLRSLEPVVLRGASAGMQTIKLSRHDFDAYASEQTAFTTDTLVVGDRGRFSVRYDGEERTLEAGESMLIAADRAVSISNETDAPGRILTLSTAPIEQPTVDSTANQPRQLAPGVVVSVAGQSQHFVSGADCLDVSIGFAVMAPGQRLPEHQTAGYELILPTSGAIDVRSQKRDLLQTDAVRQWQDERSFAAIEPGFAVAAPPDSTLSTTVTSQEPAEFWIFTVVSSGGCSSSGRSSDRD